MCGVTGSDLPCLTACIAVHNWCARPTYAYAAIRLLKEVRHTAANDRRSARLVRTPRLLRTFGSEEVRDVPSH